MTAIPAVILDPAAVSEVWTCGTVERLRIVAIYRTGKLLNYPLHRILC